MTNRRKAVVFDLYGTLVDVDVDESSAGFWDRLAARAFPDHVGIAGQQLRSLFRDSIDSELAHRSEGFLMDGAFRRLLEELGLDPSRESLVRFAHGFRAASITRLKKKEYTDELLDAVETSGYGIALISNTEALLTDYDLKCLSLGERFEEKILSSSLGVKKPDPRIFFAMLERLKLEPEQAVFLGDNFEEDIHGALNCGMDSVFVTSQPATDREAVESRFHPRVQRANFTLVSILAALRELGYELD